ncbi:MAG: hypothetical protein WBL96_18065, partial [Pseudolabrys sp.]
MPNWPAARSGRFTVFGRAHIRGIISAVSAAKPPLALRDTDNCSTVKFVPGHVINVTATIIDIALNHAIFRRRTVRLFVAWLQ